MCGLGLGVDVGMGKKGMFVCVYEISDLSFLYSHSKFMLVYITQYFTLFSVVQVCDLESHGHDFEIVWFWVSYLTSLTPSDFSSLKSR